MEVLCVVMATKELLISKMFVDFVTRDVLALTVGAKNNFPL